MRWLLAALLLWGLGGVAGAAPVLLRVGHPLCWAVTPTGAPAPALSAYRCSGEPENYQRGTLWLSGNIDRVAPRGAPATLLIHQTRFDRLRVSFAYADGAVHPAGGVRSGDYGGYWRIGGQLAFDAPVRGAPLDRVTLAFDRLTSVHLVRARLLSSGEAERESSFASALIGGALTLLLLGALYSLCLAGAIRRQFVAWHGGWGLCVLVWGLIWSQLALLAAPGIAGTAAAETCTLLATLAIACATACAVTTLPAGLLPRWSRRLVLALGWSVAALGVPAALVRGPALDPIGSVLGVLTIADLVAVAVSIGVAWRRGSPEARDFALAWAIPMATLAITQFVDIDGDLFGGGSQIAVLGASALQTAWLSIAISIRLAHLRSERDAARAAQTVLDELARRDSLTGLLNRRGFIEAANGALAAGGSFGLLLIDVDYFKQVNDRHGHDVGDAVLCRLADRLRQWEGEICFAGRLGGEEFVLGVSGLAPHPLLQFADRVREGFAACRYDALLGSDAVVTVSIGVSDRSAGPRFETLYKAADEALYEAKRAGRDRVMCRLSGVVQAASAAHP
ncbi:MAG TPA: diguanylate cyclase [Sphingomonas sp.]|nr:diguanylate cyclase [Sphingomonas sp.]